MGKSHIKQYEKIPLWGTANCDARKQLNKINGLHNPKLDSVNTGKISPIKVLRFEIAKSRSPRFGVFGRYQRFQVCKSNTKKDEYHRLVGFQIT